jgi:hypothetical protein
VLAYIGSCFLRVPLEFHNSIIVEFLMDSTYPRQQLPRW